MHALLPEPETVSNSCMPCCQSLRLCQFLACRATLGTPPGGTRRTGAKIDFPYKDLIKKSMGRGGQEKRQQKCPFTASPLPKKCSFTASPLPQKCSFTTSPLPKNAPSLRLTFSNSGMPCCQSLRLSQIHACPAARASDFLNFMHVRSLFGTPPGRQTRRTDATIYFPYKEFIKKSMGRGGQEKTTTMLFHSLPCPAARA